MTFKLAIPKTWKDKLAKETNLSKLIEPINKKDTYIIINNTAKSLNLTSSKELYKKIITKKISPPSSIDKRIELYPFMEGCDWYK